MIPKVQLVQIFRRLRKRGRGIPDHRLIHPIRDWTVGLITTFLIFVASSVYASFTFLELSKNVDTAVPIESSVVTYKQENAAEVLERYAERERTFETLRNDRSNTVVPKPSSEESEDEDGGEAEPEEEELPASLTPSLAE